MIDLSLGIGAVTTSQAATRGKVKAPPSLAASSRWNGTPGSGFEALPVDPVRTTAKPAARLLTPPNQHFSSSLLVGVIAAANDRGTLADTLGIEKVVFHFEGSSVDVLEPRWETVSTERGPRMYFGHWVRLQKTLGKAGPGHLYVETVPRDLSMQRRVTGPFVYTAADASHDLELTIAPSQTSIAGTRYPTLAQAGDYARIMGAQNPLLTIAEPGIYEVGDTPANNYGITGYCTIRASVSGVTIGKAEGSYYAAPAMSNLDMPLRFAGSNLTIDFAHFDGFLSGSNSHGRDHWFDGCHLTNSRGKDTPLLGKPQHFNGGRTVGTAWFTEVLATDLHNPLLGGTLARGCEASGCGYDLVSNSRCVVQSHLHGLDNSFWNTERPAFTVAYSGNETVARLERTGSVQGSGGGEYVLTIGAAQHRFDVGQQNNYAHYTGSNGDGYWFADVVAWLNNVPDITATLLLGSDETTDLVANTGSRPGFKGTGFTGSNALDLRSGTQTVVSYFDIHGDVYQHSVGTLENVIFAYNLVHDVQAQLLFFSPIDLGGGAAERDFLVFGNLMAVSTRAAPGFDPDVGYCQLGRGGSSVATSHVFICHNSFANQGWRINSSANALVGGQYCGFVHNTMPLLAWSDTANPAIAIDALHLHAGATLPNRATRVSFGGNETTLFADIDNGDFAPMAELLANGFAPALAFDRNRTPFPDIASTGGIAHVAEEYVQTGGSGSKRPEQDLIAMMNAAGGESGYWYLADTAVSGSQATTPDRSANGNLLRSGSLSAAPAVSAAGATFDANDLLVNDIAGGGTYSIAASWSRSGANVAANSLFSGSGGSPTVQSNDGVGTAIPQTWVIDGAEETLCTTRDQLFDALAAVTSEVVIFTQGFDMTGKTWIGLGRGSGTMPMVLRKAAILREADYSADNLALARQLAKEAVIT